MKNLVRVILLGVLSLGAQQGTFAQSQQADGNASQSALHEQLQREAITWAKVGAMGTIFSSGFVAVSIVVLLWQVRKLSHATAAQSFFSAAERLQDESLRGDRKYVFDLRDAETPMSSWDLPRVERVCHNYDVVGIMVRNGMLPKRMIIDSWGDSLYRSWPIVFPLIEKYRAERGGEFLG